MSDGKKDLLKSLDEAEFGMCQPNETNPHMNLR